MAENRFSYDTQGTITYLVYEIQPGDVVDTMGLGMLTNNKIQGLAGTQFTQMDTSRYIKFNVSAKIPVSQFFSGPVNRKRLIGVFKGIVSALISAEDYMIDPNSILLDLDYIFTDVSTCETILICLPLQQDRPPVNLGQFFKNIMFSTQFDQTENCDYVAKIMNYLNSAPVFSTYDFDALMDRLAQDGAAQPSPAIQQSAPAMKSEAVLVQDSVQKAGQKPVQQPAQPSIGRPNQQPVYQQSAYAQTNPQQPVFQQIPAVPQKPVQGQLPNAQQTAQQGQMVQQPTQQPAAPEKKMSYLNLLMHYNKENAAAYKAQKEAEKAAKKGGAAASAAEAAKKQKKEKPKKGGAPASFAVPGQSPGFAVPGQQPQGFAVPGQQPAAPAQQPQTNGRQPQGFAVPGQQLAMSVPQPQAAARQPQSFSAPAQPAVTPKQPQPTNPPFAQPGNPAQQPSGFAMPAQGMSFGETTVLGGGGGIGETTVLGAVQQEQQQRPHLVRVKNNERIMVDKPVFRIGKERSYVDYFVGDNPAVSRSHANIISRDGTYFIMDTNSTNHTYVNGGMIQSNAEVKLFHGTKIRLANEEFEFRLY